MKEPLMEIFCLIRSSLLCVYSVYNLKKGSISEASEKLQNIQETENVMESLFI